MSNGNGRTNDHNDTPNPKNVYHGEFYGLHNNKISLITAVFGGSDGHFSS
jgi:hypothetical protein